MLVLLGAALETFIAPGLFASSAPSAGAPACVGGSLPIATFHLIVLPSKQGSGLPLRDINRVRAGDRLRYVPVRLPANVQSKKAKIAVVVVSANRSGKDRVAVLPARFAKSTGEWTIPVQASVVGVIFGPQGLDLKKFNRLVDQNPELISQLASYARQTATVNALISTLSQYDSSKPGTEDIGAVLKGFSSRYGVGLPQLSAGEPPSQQAEQLLQAVMPTVSDYNPGAQGAAPVIQQSAGLAASMAMLFYGTPVGLAAGGAQLLENLHTLVSPKTDFRAAFAEPRKQGNLSLCSEAQTAKTRMRTAYLWMLRIPNAAPPEASLAEAANIPLGIQSHVKITCATHEQLRLLLRARDWSLESSGKNSSIPVKVTVGSDNDVLSLDLSHTPLQPGDYQLAALWDWQPFLVKGDVHVRAFGNFKSARLSASSQDRLIAGKGIMAVKLSGADFEFVKSVALQSVGSIDPKPQTLDFTLPDDSRSGVQSSLETEVDTSKLKAGKYDLLLTQDNGEAQTVPFTLHLPNPVLNDLPVRVNLGQRNQAVLLVGTGLDRIEKISSADAVWTLSPLPPSGDNGSERKAVVRLLEGAQQGQVLGGSMTVEGISQPLEIPALFKVAGPLPEIVKAEASFSSKSSVAIAKGEIPAGSSVSFAIRVRHIGGRPSLNLACRSATDAKQALSLRPGDRKDQAELDYTSPSVLFLTFDPGVVGQSGCDLVATVTTADAGTSLPYELGRITRMPQIDKFFLTDHKLSGSLYLGYLTGQNLQRISATGWNTTTGYPVQGIPTPVPGDNREQTLKVELPWPPPAPQSPICVWLFGEKQGRLTTARY